MPPPFTISLSMDSLLHRFLHPFPHKPSKPKPKPKPKAFLTTQSITSLETLTNFKYTHHFQHGTLYIRQMDPKELDATSKLLADSFGEAMWMPEQYAVLLAFLVKRYILERRLLVPHTATLVGFYQEGEEGEKLACTAEVSFDGKGASGAPPTPVPPRDCPYVCNMTVEKSLRRKGIGWQLLKACEELISQMKTLRKVYLHCRVVDTGPFSMYTRAGYRVVKTDTVLVWLSLQRRKYLMYKELPLLDDDRSDTSDLKEHPV